MGGREVGSSESMYATTHVSSDTACWRHWEWSISCICTYSLIFRESKTFFVKGSRSFFQPFELRFTCRNSSTYQIDHNQFPKLISSSLKLQALELGAFS